MIDSFTGAYRFLSNFYPCIIQLEGIEYPSAEHAYVAQKTLDIEVRHYVAKMPSTSKVKKFGRNMILRPDWDSIKFKVMNMIVKEKFYQNENLMELLVSTRPHQLIEGNAWGDTYWGVCNGEGLNMLGIILMNIRDFPTCTCITKTPDLNYHTDDCYAKRFGPSLEKVL